MPEETADDTVDCRKNEAKRLWRQAMPHMTWHAYKKLTPDIGSFPLSCQTPRIQRFFNSRDRCHKCRAKRLLVNTLSGYIELNGKTGSHGLPGAKSRACRLAEWRSESTRSPLDWRVPGSSLAGTVGQCRDCGPGGMATSAVGD
ncbi:unnamed protein product, partial [Protopolystoma xenopodis]